MRQVVEDVGWRGVRIDRRRSARSKGKPAPYPVARGTVIGVGPKDALLWTHGAVLGIDQRGSYFQGGRSTPRPVRLVRPTGHGRWDNTARRRSRCRRWTGTTTASTTHCR
jgi:hypothetical protein